MGPHVLEVERIQNTSSYDYFSLVGTSPSGLLRHMAAKLSRSTGSVDLSTARQYLLALVVQTASGYWRYPSLITGKCPAITFIYAET